MKGNELSIKELAELKYDPLFKYCLKLSGGDEQLARESASDVFLRAEKLGDPPKHPNIEGWLKRTARNIVHEKLRERKEYYRRNVSLEGMLDDGRGLTPAFFERENAFLERLWDGGADEPDDAELERLKEDILGELPPPDRELMELRYERKLPLAEIAELMGRSKDAVRVKLSRLTDKVTIKVRTYFEDRTEEKHEGS